MKQCLICNEFKDMAQFGIKLSCKDGLNTRCKSCVASYSREYYRENKEKYANRRRKYRYDRRGYIKSVKNLPCKDCNVVYPYYVMDFDHRNPQEKEFLISHAGYGSTIGGKNRKFVGSHGVSFDRLLKEIEKCDIVCSNCHRVRTHNRRNEIHN